MRVRLVDHGHYVENGGEVYDPPRLLLDQAPGSGCTCDGRPAPLPGRDAYMARAAVAWMGDQAPENPAPRDVVDVVPCACKQQVRDAEPSPGLRAVAKAIAFQDSSDGRDTYMARLERAHLRHR